jgi:hypothetical protein
MRLAHPSPVTPDLPDDVRELIRHFAELAEDDRARIVALVRSLSFCRTVEFYSTSWAGASSDQGSGMRSMSLPVCDPCV